MPRRAKLALAALLTLAAVVAAGFSLRAPRPQPTLAVSTADSSGDSRTARDTAASRDSQPVEDPPCLASRIGLPCR